MRIIAGKHRGRVLAPIRGMAIRPTPDRVKESLFQILSDRLSGACVLDLFSGSGALGLECLSRGAKSVLFNDSAKESTLLIQKNLRLAGETARVLSLDFRTLLQRTEGGFDLILCDPPYKEEFLKEILTTVKERKLLNAGGLVIYESEREECGAEGWQLFDSRNYGRVNITICQL